RSGKSQEQVAAELGVSRVAVTYWASGKRKPNTAKRADLFRVLSIPEAAWDEPAPPREVRARPDVRSATVGRAASNPNPRQGALLEGRARHLRAALPRNTEPPAP